MITSATQPHSHTKDRAHHHDHLNHCQPRLVHSQSPRCCHKAQGTHFLPYTVSLWHKEKIPIIDSFCFCAWDGCFICLYDMRELASATARKFEWSNLITVQPIIVSQEGSAGEKSVCSPTANIWSRIARKVKNYKYIFLVQLVLRAGPNSLF